MKCKYEIENVLFTDNVNTYSLLYIHFFLYERGSKDETCNIKTCFSNINASK